MPAQVEKRVTDTRLILPKNVEILGGKVTLSNAISTCNDFVTTPQTLRLPLLKIRLKNVEKPSDAEHAKKPKRVRKSRAKDPDGLAKTARCYRVTIHSGMCPKKMARSIEDAIYQYFVEQRHHIFIAHVKVVLEIPVKSR